MNELLAETMIASERRLHKYLYTYVEDDILRNGGNEN